MTRWVRDDREVFLKEFIRLEGRGSSFRTSGCSVCPSVDLTLYRCDDCMSGQVLCKECLVERHALHPFHRIEVSILSHYWAPPDPISYRSAGLARSTNEQPSRS